MKAIYGGPLGEEIKESRIKAYGWVNASGNWSTAKNSNTPDSYWIVPNRYELDQFVFRLERQVDSVQTDLVFCNPLSANCMSWPPLAELIAFAKSLTFNRL